MKISLVCTLTILNAVNFGISSGKSNDVDSRYIAKLAPKLNTFHNTLTSMVLASKPEKNVIYSPISVSTTLAILGYGAKGNTSKELLELMGIDLRRSSLTGFSELVDILQDTPEIKINFANSIFLLNKVELQSSFKEFVNQFFNMAAEEISDLNEDSQVATINNWCKKQTNNHITEIVKPSDLEEAVMILANAIYFQGSWKFPFDPSRTFPGTFDVSSNKSVLVPMMIMEEDLKVGYIDSIDAKFAEFPYANDKDNHDQFSMFIIIPDEERNGDLNKIEKNLDKINFNELDSFSSPTNLIMPKFKLDSKLDVGPILKNMGIKQIFDHEAADFGKMVGKKHVFVSKMFQKAVLEVDESGTVAAAVTAIDMWNRFSPFEMHVSRPFLCAIVLRSLGIPLFYARVVDPSQK